MNPKDHTDATIPQKVNTLAAMVRTAQREADTLNDLHGNTTADPVGTEIAKAATSGSRNMETLVITILNDSARRTLFDEVWQRLAVRQREQAAMVEVAPAAELPLPVVGEPGKKGKGKKARKAAQA